MNEIFYNWIIILFCSNIEIIEKNTFEIFINFDFVFINVLFLLEIILFCSFNISILLVFDKFANFVSYF